AGGRGRWLPAQGQPGRDGARRRAPDAGRRRPDQPGRRGLSAGAVSGSANPDAPGRRAPDAARDRATGPVLARTQLQVGRARTGHLAADRWRPRQGDLSQAAGQLARRGGVRRRAARTADPLAPYPWRRAPPPPRLEASQPHPALHPCLARSPMSVRVSLIVPAAVAVVAALALSACGDGRSADATAAESASTAAALEPEALMLRALECHRTMGRARQVPDRMPAQINERFASTPEI